MPDRHTISRSIALAAALGFAIFAAAVFAPRFGLLGSFFKSARAAEVDPETALLRRELNLLLAGEASCAVTEGGPRVVCALRDGQLSRMELADTDQLVRAPRPGQPLKRKHR